MKKNTASQVVVAQLVSKTDGSAVTSGTTTVYVLGDGGTQATGSVGSGAATHEGNGVWSYAPAQAETNYDHVAFTFVNTNAVNATVQIYTSFPQTGDNFARLGAPAGASVSADIAAVAGYVDTEVAAIKAKTDNLPSDPADASDIAASFSTVNSTLSTIAGYIDTEVAAIKAKTDNLPSDPADASDIASAFSTVNSTLTTIAGYIDTEVAAIKAKTDNLPSDPADASDVAGLIAAVEAKVDTIDGIVDAILVDTSEIGAAGAGLTVLATAAALSTVAGYVDTEVGAIKAVTDKLDDTLEDDSGTYRFTTNALEQAPSGGTPPTTAQIADKFLGRNLAGGSDGGRTVSDALRTLRNRSEITAGTLTVYEEDDTTPAWTAAATTAPGDPLTSIDPT